MLNINKTYLIAVSGGKDSVVLLDYLVKKLPNPQKQLIVAHFNHQIRLNSNQDLNFVQKLAQQQKLTFISKTANIPQLNKGNLEATARQHRYQFLETVRNQLKLDYIVTAHHQDDQVETILLNWSRGAGLKGLQGMSIYDAKRKLLRPFLDKTSAELELYLKNNNLEFTQDPTNFDTKYTRNNLRHIIIPKLNKLYPDFNQVILEIAQLAQQLDYYYLTQLLNSPLALTNTKSGYKFSRPAFRQQSIEIQLYFLYTLFQAFNLPTNKANILQTQKLINQHSSGQKIEQNNITIWIDANHINFTESQKNTTSQPLTINLTQIKDQLIVNWNNQKLKIEQVTKIKPNSVAIKSSQKTITIRSFKPGDRIKPLGLGGTKKLKNVLIDKKIPKRNRANLPIITTNNEILGIPNLINSEACRLQSQNHCHFAVTLVDS